jgi:hypothetical protein
MGETMKPDQIITAPGAAAPAFILKYYLITARAKDGARPLIFNSWTGEWQRELTNQCAFSNAAATPELMAMASSKLPTAFYYDAEIMEGTNV